MANFVYLVIDEKTKEALVVDSGWETGPIEEAVSKEGATVKYVVATHEHFDHTSTLDLLAGKLGAVVVAYQGSPVRCDVTVKDGDSLNLGAKAVRVLHTPGHTEDSLCLYDGTNVFTGDTLFVGTIGRFERERTGVVYRSLYHVLLGLPLDTMMYPGHDYGDVPCRTLGEEKGANPYLGSRDEESFMALFS